MNFQQNKQNARKPHKKICYMKVKMKIQIKRIKFQRNQLRSRLGYYQIVRIILEFLQQNIANIHFKVQVWIQEMDFDKLYEVLPKYSTTWTIDDIETWLTFIGLCNMVKKFREASIDGSCLSQLSEQDFKIELGIESKILLKKIMTWITQGIKNYDIYLGQRQSLNSSKTLGGRLNKSIKQSLNKRVSEGKREMSEQKNDLLKEEEHEYGAIIDEIEQVKARKREGTQTQAKDKKQLNQLIIKQCQSSLASCFSLKQHGGTIGRHSKNQIHIVDQCVSRFHAQIEYKGTDYFIRDLGSSSGTFIRITQKTRLFHGIIIQMGSNQFQAIMNKPEQITLRIIEGPNVQDLIELPQKMKINVGRKATNQINFPDDQHLSNIHSTFYQVEDIWYIEDLGTTNGTWLRLSPETVKSEQFLLENGTQFKLGGNVTYECQKTCTNRKTEKQKSDKCSICKITQKNCIFLPCKHNICCLKCAQMNEISHCTVCGSTVNDIMKIFKV